MSLHVLAYNLKRLISSLGMARTIKAMRLLAGWTRVSLLAAHGQRRATIERKTSPAAIDAGKLPRFHTASAEAVQEPRKLPIWG